MNKEQALAGIRTLAGQIDTYQKVFGIELLPLTSLPQRLSNYQRVAIDYGATTSECTEAIVEGMCDSATKDNQAYFN